MQCGAFSRRGSLKRNENGPCCCCCHLGCVPQPNTANVGTLPRKQLSAEIRHPPKLLCEIVAGLIDLPSKPCFGEKETICQTPRGCERERVGERKFNVCHLECDPSTFSPNQTNQKANGLRTPKWATQTPVPLALVKGWRQGRLTLWIYKQREPGSQRNGPWPQIKTLIYKDERGIECPNHHGSPWPLSWSFNSLGELFVESASTGSWRIASNSSIPAAEAHVSGVRVLKAAVIYNRAGNGNRKIKPEPV